MLTCHHGRHRSPTHRPLSRGVLSLARDMFRQTDFQSSGFHALSLRVSALGALAPSMATCDCGLLLMHQDQSKGKHHHQALESRRGIRLLVQASNTGLQDPCMACIHTCISCIHTYMLLLLLLLPALPFCHHTPTLMYKAHNTLLLNTPSYLGLSVSSLAKKRPLFAPPSRYAHNYFTLVDWRCNGSKPH